MLKPTTISIPQSYTNYIGSGFVFDFCLIFLLAPIHSTFMYQTMINGYTPYWCSGMGFHGRRLPEMLEDGSWKIIDRFFQF